MRSAAAKVTSKGQITIPLEVRKRLGVQAGDSVVFRLDDANEQEITIAPEAGGVRAFVTRVPDLIALGGSMAGPKALRGRPWPEVRDKAWEAELRHRR